jgi:hypothetical protein
VQTLERVCGVVGYPKSIRVDQGPESSRAIWIDPKLPPDLGRVPVDHGDGRCEPRGSLRNRSSGS